MSILWIVYIIWIVFAITCAVLVEYEYDVFGFLFLLSIPLMFYVPFFFI